MPYLDEQAAALTRVLDHAVDLKNHRLAGYAANLDFWVAEVEHLLRSIDGYPQRFARMEEATASCLAARRSDPFEVRPELTGQEHDVSPASSPSTASLHTLRNRLLASAARFLRRCRKAGLVENEQYLAACERLGIGSE